LLNGADVVAVLQQVGSEAVAQVMHTGVLMNFGCLNGPLHGPLYAILQDVVPANAPGTWVLGTQGRRKDILPGPGRCSIGVFARQCVRHLYLPISFSQVENMQGFCVLELPMQPIHQLGWQHGFAFPVAFGFPHRDFPAGKVNVLDTQA
jgi:hypothetical protein